MIFPPCAPGLSGSSLKCSIYFLTLLPSRDNLLQGCAWRPAPPPPLPPNAVGAITPVLFASRALHHPLNPLPSCLPHQHTGCCSAGCRRSVRRCTGCSPTHGDCWSSKASQASEPAQQVGTQSRPPRRRRCKAQPPKSMHV